MQRTLILTTLIAALLGFNMVHAEQGTDRLSDMLDRHAKEHDARDATSQAYPTDGLSSRQTQ